MDIKEWEIGLLLKCYLKYPLTRGHLSRDLKNARKALCVCIIYVEFIIIIIIIIIKYYDYFSMCVFLISPVGF